MITAFLHADMELPEGASLDSPFSLLSSPGTGHKNPFSFGEDGFQREEKDGILPLDLNLLSGGDQNGSWGGKPFVSLVTGTQKMLRGKMESSILIRWHHYLGQSG